MKFPGFDIMEKNQTADVGLQFKLNLTVVVVNYKKW